MECDPFWTYLSCTISFFLIVLTAKFVENLNSNFFNSPWFVALVVLVIHPLYHYGLFTTFVTTADWVATDSCSDTWITPNNFTGLHYAFRGRLYGQDRVHRQLEDIMHSYFEDKNPHRPLVLSFHGPTGTGKNHVSRLIAESIYKKGMESQHVHLKIPTRDCPHEGDIQAYKEALQNEITTSVSKCGRQLFIFDEIENFPSGYLDAIKPYVDYHETLAGIDYRKSMFLFLSNVGGREITEILVNSKSFRKTLKINEFQKVIERAAFNKKGSGFHRSRLMDSHLIGHYIPFLPLEREHVELCLEEEAMKMGLPPLSDEMKSKVLEEIEFWPEDTQRFAVKGCKNVREKLNLYVYQYQQGKSNRKTEL